MSSERTRNVGRRTGVRRRPSGEPAPLPREPLAGSGKFWVPLGLLVVIIFALLLSSTTFLLGQGSFWDGIDQNVVEWMAQLRNDALTTLSRAVNSLTDAWFLRVLRWGVVIVLVLYKRWRHLVAFVGLILVLQPMLFMLANLTARPRPDGIEILDTWAEFSTPSLPIAALTITLVGMAYAVAIKGPGREAALVASAIVIVLVGFSRNYLAVERMTDTIAGAVLAAVAALLVFRLWTPDSVFPVSYSRRKVAHLELTDVRREAIFTALREQLGLQATDVRLFALEASGGSSPLLITLDGDGPDQIFAKLYAQNHVRSDRWYKLGRSLLYGALEDEGSFRSVRALAEYEDYIMRLMQSAGVPGPASLGIVEITQGREYMLVTQFITASEISKAEVTDAVVDGGLGAVRSMWDAGLAHRDIKPGNVLVRGDEIYLIDAAFGETRPSAWREAVDLANMMLTLSLGTSADQVYQATLTHFTEDDIAEALAATRGVTIPTELSRGIKNDPRDVLGQLRRMAPEREPIRIQRWTRRRIALLVATGVLAGIALWLIVVNLAVVGNLL